MRSDYYSESDHPFVIQLTREEVVELYTEFVALFTTHPGYKFDSDGCYSFSKKEADILKGFLRGEPNLNHFVKFTTEQ